MFKIIVKTFFIILTLQIALQAREINIDNILLKAKSENKHLFVWLHKSGCGYCENMREFTLENETVNTFIQKHFLFVHINVSEKDNITYHDFKSNGRAFAQEVGYDFYPSSLFFADDGEIELGEVGFVDSEKEPNEERIYKMLNYIKSKSYEKSDYNDYKFKITEEL